MANLPGLPISMLASVQTGSVSVSRSYNNASSIYNGYPYFFSCTLTIIPLTNSDPAEGYEFNSGDIVPGMWLLQQSGMAFEIVSVGVHTSDTEVAVELKDVNLYNLLSDYSQTGNN